MNGHIRLHISFHPYQLCLGVIASGIGFNFFFQQVFGHLLKEVKTQKRRRKNGASKNAKNPTRRGKISCISQWNLKKRRTEPAPQCVNIFIQVHQKLMTTIVNIRRQKLPESVFDMKFA